MPYSRIALPVNGYTDSLPYRGSVQGYTQNCENVFPYDTFDNRRRIGTRPGFIQIANTDTKVQGCVAVEAFVNKGSGAQLIRRFVYCVGGAFYATDLTGNPVAVKQVARQTHTDTTVMNPFNASYDRYTTVSANLPLNAAGTTAVDAEASGSARNADVNVADVVLDTSADVEMVAFKHVGLPDSQANATTSGGTTSGGTSLSAITIPDQEPRDFVYATDGSKYVKINMSLEPPEVSQWIGPYATVNAIEPGTTNKRFASLIAQFNSRIALSGIPSAATNWFISKIGDPYDWVPTAGVDVTVDALAGSSGTKFGEVGDNIKALIPVGSSGLMFGCQNSLSILTNDPVFSDATIRQISRSVGCLGPRSFSKVGEMAVLVASPQGVFAINPNTFDIEKGARATKDKLDRLFANTDFEDTSVVMGYDEGRSIVFLCITRRDDASASRIYAYDVDTGSWWPWTIANPSHRAINNIVSFQPVSGTRSTPWMTTDEGFIVTLPEDAVQSQDGGVLSSTTFGSSGSGVTSHNPTADAKDIDSTVELGPINGDPSRRIMLKEVRVILGAQEERDSSGNVQTPDTTNGPFLEVINGDTAQEAVGTVSGFTVVEENIPVLDCQTLSSFETIDSESVIDGGDKDANPTSGTEKILWGGFANSIAGTYTPATGNTILNDTTFSGPGSWTFSRNSNGKWEFKHGTDFYLATTSNLDWFVTTNAVDGLPEEVDLNTLMFGRQTDNQARLSLSNFVNRNASEKRALARGRDSANRFRIRASDIFVSISALGRSFAIEDISVDVEDGGPFRSSS
jgi:hypothetical protein